MSTLIESILSTEWRCLKIKLSCTKAITILKRVMLLTLTCRNLSTDIIGRHMAVTPFKFPPLFRKPKNVEVPKRLWVRAVIVDSSNIFFSDTAGYSKSRFELNVPKNATNKMIFQIFAFLIIAAGL